MPMIVVGGQHRKIGKTALVTSILHDFPHLRWQAVKFTSHRHDPQACEQVFRENGFSVWRQSRAAAKNFTRSGVSLQSHVPDTARYLAAGAAAAFLVQYETRALEPACHWLRTQIPNSEPVIAEATSAAEFLVPDLFLMILDPSSEDFKSSAAQLLSRTDACVLARSQAPTAVLPPLIAGKPLIRLEIRYDRETLRNLICSRLSALPPRENKRPWIR
ncbi:MAG TPA: hypothetical protein VFQ00_08925 [Terriglobales bacterium]|nr:hypothetical protein [Terriglobales bacterium]